MSSLLNSHVFQCERCGYETPKKFNLITHWKRAKTCPATCKDIPTSELLQKFTTKEVTGKTYPCDKCNKAFSSRQSKSRHMKTCDAQPPQPTEKDFTSMQAMLDVLNKKLEDQAKVIQQLLLEKHATTHIHNQNNGTIHNDNRVTLNVNLRNFDQEDKAAIPDDFIRNCLMNLEFRGLIENLHFDPNFPHNMNFRVVSIKRGVAEIYKGDQWHAIPLSTGVNELIQQSRRIFQWFYRENKEAVCEDVGGEEALMLVDKLQHIQEEHRKVLQPIHKDVTAMVTQKGVMLLTS